MRFIIALSVFFFTGLKTFAQCSGPVTGLGASGITSSSAIISFTTPDAGVFFVIKYTDGVTNYRQNVNDPGPTYPKIVNSPITNLAENTEYTVTVMRYCTVTDSSESTSIDFTTLVGTCDSVTSPIVTTTNSTATETASEAAYGDSYIIQYIRQGQTDTAELTGADADFNLTGLKPASNYYYRIGTICDDDTVYNSFRIFATKTSPAYTPLANYGAQSNRLLAMKVLNYPAVNGEPSVIIDGKNDYPLIVQDTTAGSNYYFNPKTQKYFKEGVDVVEDITELKAHKLTPRRIFVKDSARGGSFNLTYDLTITDDGGIYFAADSVGAGYFWKRDISTSKSVNIKWWGAVSGSEITSYLRTINARNYRSVLLPRGTWIVDSVVFTNPVELYGEGGQTVIELKTPTVLNANAIRLEADNSSIHDLTVDGDSTSRTGIYVTANNCYVNVFMKDFTADATSTTSTSGLFILGNNFKGAITAKNFMNTGQANGSNPRVVTIGGMADNYYFDYIQADTLRAGAVIGQSTGDGVIMNMALRYAQDNGIYHLGGTGLTVGTMSYNGNEEGIVTERAVLQVGQIIGDGRWNRLLGIEDAKYVNVGKIIMHQDSATGSGNAVTLRTGNVESQKIFIGEITGTLRGDNLMAFGSGSLDYLTIGSIDVHYYYNATYSGTLSNWADLSHCHGVSISNFRVKIIDESSALANSNRFLLTYPSDSLTQLSFINNVQVNITDADEETLSDAVFRGVNFAQELVKAKDIVWDNTDIPYAREVNAQEDAFPNTTNFIPTQGYWYWGTKLGLRQRRKRAFDIMCISSGTPGEWINSAMVNVRRTTSQTITIDSLDDVILSLPNVGNTIATLPDPANGEAFHETAGGAQYTRVYRVKNIAESTNPYTLYIKTPSGKIIDFGSGVDSLLLTPSKHVDLVSNGTNWHVLGGNKDTSYFNKINDSLFTTKGSGDSLATHEWLRNKFLAASVSGSDVTTTSATATNVTGLTVAVEANKKYKVQASLWIGCDNTGGVQFAINGPAGSAVLSGAWQGSAGAAATNQTVRLAAMGTLSAAGATFIRVNSSGGMVNLLGYFTTSSTAGNVVIQFASNVAGQTSTVFIGSTMDITEVK